DLRSATAYGGLALLFFQSNCFLIFVASAISLPLTLVPIAPGVVEVHLREVVTRRVEQDEAVSLARSFRAWNLDSGQVGKLFLQFLGDGLPKPVGPPLPFPQFAYDLIEVCL